MAAISKETVSAMILSRTGFFNIRLMKELYLRAGSFSAVTDHSSDIQAIVPDCPRQLANALKNIEAMRSRVDEELEFIEANNIQVLTLADNAYPQRLKECVDAPLVLFFKGNANLNAKRVINIIGTRHATVYADDCIRQFTEQLKTLCPEILIVSGLAYGVDIMAHRHSLENGIPTVGVVAHGLDNLYPPRHRETANRMIENGGLLTEYFTHTNADKVNFVRRNRIVAGMSDATVLVESAARGGGLITCSMAQSYGRDVFAFPGRVGDATSEGCNNLIRDDGARLITSATDMVRLLGWEDDARLATAQRQGIERSLFPELSDEERRTVSTLTEGDLQLNAIAAKASLPISRIAPVLFGLEMKGVVKTLPGGMYHLIK